MRSGFCVFDLDVRIFIAIFCQHVSILQPHRDVCIFLLLTPTGLLPRWHFHSLFIATRRALSRFYGLSLHFHLEFRKYLQDYQSFTCSLFIKLIQHMWITSTCVVDVYKRQVWNCGVRSIQCVWVLFSRWRIRQLCSNFCFYLLRILAKEHKFKYKQNDFHIFDFLKLKTRKSM